MPSGHMQMGGAGAAEFITWNLGSEVEYRGAGPQRGYDLELFLRTR